MITTNSQKVHNSAISLSTPYSNTGLKPQKCSQLDTENGDCPSLYSSVDYLQGVFFKATLESVQKEIDYIAKCFDDVVVWELDKPLFAGVLWQFSAFSVRGMKVGFSEVEPEIYKIWLSVPGGCWRQLSGREHWQICCYLFSECDFKANRIDLKLRDYSRRKTPSDLLVEASKGNVGRARKYGISGEGSVGTDCVSTAYFGSRKSDKFLRVYDAKPVHGEDAIDWECQLRGDKADVCFREFTAISPTTIVGDEIVSNSDLVARYIGAVVVGCVEFINKVEGIDLSRQERQVWWQQFVDEVGGQIRISPPKKDTSVERTFRWIDKQVVVKMAALRRGLGDKSFKRYMVDSLNKAESRFRDVHRGIIKILSNVEGGHPALTCYDFVL